MSNLVLDVKPRNFFRVAPGVLGHSNEGPPQYDVLNFIPYFHVPNPVSNGKKMIRRA